MEADSTKTYNQDTVGGFTRLNGLPPARGIAANVYGKKRERCKL